MATYFPSPENQRETSNIIHLRESLPSSYSEGQVLQGNMMYMNYASSSGAFSGMPGGSESNQSQQEMLSDFGGGSRVGDHDLNEWKDGRNGMLLMHPMGAAADFFLGPQNLQGGQGLSLTLSTHVPSGFQMPSFQCRNPDQGFSSLLSEDRNVSLGNHDGSPNKQSRVSEYVPAGFSGGSCDPMRADASSYGRSGIARVIPNSKYLKAAQQLLDEVINVKKAMEQNSKNRSVKDSKNPDGGAKNGASETAGAGSSSNVEELSTNSPGELSAAEKQDLQNKMTKLLAMLDEVDRRYKQYYHQMQIVVSSFDVIAGPGAAKPYTALALQTISRHFRCLRDAINEQVQVTRKSLGDQDSSENSKGVGISRLRYIDQQIRQQRALQQLGMMQQHAWRPQRGLPETSVSILRAWLFEHFLHPYPKDSDKIMLARQTGLTRSQVSNWFINARVRLWKPMVEEMYKEEIGDGEMDINSPSDLATKPTNSEAKASDDRGEYLQQSTTSTPTERCNTGHLIESRSDHFTDTDFMEQNIDNAYQNVNHHTEPEIEYGLSGKSVVQSDEGNERLMAAYHMSELERFENGNNGVSLTLGLQQCEGSNNVPMSIETHQGYIYTSAATATSSMGSEATEFDCMNGGNRVIHHRFGSSHLLHDFVA